MSFFSSAIYGQLFTGGGDVVVAGKIEAWLVPSGATVPDGNDVSIRYKVVSYTRGMIDTTGIQSFFLTPLYSVNPGDAYYRIRFEITDPVYDVWEELWSFKVTGSVSTVAITSIAILKYGPTPDHLVPGLYTDIRT